MQIVSKELSSSLFMSLDYGLGTMTAATWDKYRLWDFIQIAS